MLPREMAKKQSPILSSSHQVAGNRTCELDEAYAQMDFESFAAQKLINVPGVDGLKPGHAYFCIPHGIGVNIILEILRVV